MLMCFVRGGMVVYHIPCIIIILLLLLIYLTPVVICSNARIACYNKSSHSIRQPQGLMNDCSIERQSKSTIRFNLGSFLYWITGPFKDRYPPA